MKNKRFRVALAGCGVIAPNHLEVLASDPRIEICALCDIAPERAEKLAKVYAPGAAIYTDYLEMLDREMPDAFHVCTPHYLHAPMAIAALERDIPVFLEKPMVMKREEIDALFRAEKASKGRVCVCFQNRDNAATARAMEVVREDGGVTGAYAALFWSRPASYYNKDAWRGKQATEGGGVLINQAIHTLDLLTVFLGKPASLEAKISNHALKGVIEVEDTAEMLIRFENGKTATFFASNTMPEGSPDSTLVTLLTAHHRIDIRNDILMIDNELVSLDRVKAIGKAAYGAGHAKLIPEFYDALEHGSPIPVPIEIGQYAIRIVLAAYESNGREVPV